MAEPGIVDPIRDIRCAGSAWYVDTSVGATPFDGVIVQPENEAESASASFGGSSN